MKTRVNNVTKVNKVTKVTEVNEVTLNEVTKVTKVAMALVAMFTDSSPLQRKLKAALLPALVPLVIKVKRLAWTKMEVVDQWTHKWYDLST